MAPERVLLAGGTGFLGRELGRHLVASGYDVTVLVRGKEAPGLPFPARAVAWNGRSLPAGTMRDIDVVINLAGAGIADRAWSAARRREIVASRVDAVQAIVEACTMVDGEGPRLLVQASAVGFYGDRGEERLGDKASAGAGFLAETCVAWEAATAPLVGRGMRVAIARFGMILGLTGGALPTLLGVYARGLGARLGSGKQWLPWIHVDDAVQLVARMITDARYDGAVNVTAPEPCRQQEMHAALVRHGGYGDAGRVPELAVRATLGARAEIVLASARVEPTLATHLGMTWRFETVEAALADLLGGARQRGSAWLVTRQWLPASPAAVWRYFADETNLAELTPPWLHFRVLEKTTPSLREGSHIRYALRLRGLPVAWESAITQWVPERAFVDEQVRGPYAFWRHEHTFAPLAGGTVVSDAVEYKVPLGRVGALAAGWLVERELGTIFAHRRRVMAGLGLEARERP